MLFIDKSQIWMHLDVIGVKNMKLEFSLNWFEKITDHVDRIWSIRSIKKAIERDERDSLTSFGSKSNNWRVWRLNCKFWKLATDQLRKIVKCGGSNCQDRKMKD